MTGFSQNSALKTILPGVLLAAVLAWLAKLFADQVAAGIAGAPKLPLSPVLCAVLLGMLWRNTIGLPGWSVQGLSWAMKALLRLGIALIGLRLTLAGASSIAATALPVVIVCISAALILGTVVARALGVSRGLALLLAVGTAVCGCTAVIAVAPLIRAQHAETAFAVACVVLFGCVAMICYPWVAGYFFAASPLHAGVFLGTSIHDTSQVVGSAMIYSQQAGAPDALTAASLTKLLRNLSMAALLPLAAWWMHRQAGAEAGEKPDRSEMLPLFVLGFIGCIVLRSAGDAMFVGSAAAGAWQGFISMGQTASEVLLVLALAAVGLSVSFAQMWRIGWRPLASAFVVATLVGACSLGGTLLMMRLFT